jgi:hypothetical protein
MYAVFWLDLKEIDHLGELGVYGDDIRMGRYGLD